MIISPREEIDLKGTINIKAQCLVFRLSLSIILIVRRILIVIFYKSKEELVVFLLI